MNQFKIIVKRAAAILAVGGYLSFAVGVSQAQLAGTFYTNCLVAPVTLQTSASNLLAGSIVTNRVWQGRHLGIGLQFAGGSATNTGTIGFQFGVMFRGANGLVTTTRPFTINSTANGTALVNDWAVLPNYTLGPADAIVLLGITNAMVNVNPVLAGSVTVSNVWLQFDTRP
jgi:hypothetical protein